MDTEYTVVGGGVVGLSVAWGLLKRGRSVRVLDGDDGSFRASRGNFGLVWVQSKGLGAPDYARWSKRAAAAWGEFAAELEDASGLDVALVQDGGYDLHFDDQTLAETVEKYERLKAQLDGDYPFEVLGANALRREEPAIGPQVTGAILHHEDGHVNPLKLLKALAFDVRRLGAEVLTGRQVNAFEHRAGEFRTRTDGGEEFASEKVVLTAGLGAIALGPMLGFKAPISPLRGQVLITEKLPRLINRPSLIARQVDEGGVQIGDSKENVGFDDRETLATTAGIAARAVRAYPELAKAKLLRSWGALRIMSPDGLPIYQQSKTMPGAFLVTCHSGVTLASSHARFLPDWFEQADGAPDLRVFSEDRFDV
jgi:glycine/D-amino acid oxidase-like deaminating enzyme